jgi:8-oxo-dGTP pyrophosphatase MutT (NUDIX family)
MAGHPRCPETWYPPKPDPAIAAPYYRGTLVILLTASQIDYRVMTHFPVSIKAVLFDQSRVILLENERAEWELPGGRLEPGETPELCLQREIAEELGITVRIDRLLDCWVYEVLPGRHVVIVTYGAIRADAKPLKISAEHRRLALFTMAEIEALPMPDGYRRSIRFWQDAVTQS